MEISLRSQMAAGIAVAGAAAIAVTPIVQPDVVPSLERVSANIQIASWADPLNVLGNSLQLLGNSLFGTELNTSPPPAGYLPLGDAPAPLFQTPQGLIPQLLNGSLISTQALPPVVIGQVPGTPLLAAVGTNVSKYATAGINSLAAVSDATGALVFGLPLTAFEVINDLINGNPIDIAQIIEDNIITPLTNAFETVVDQTSYIVESVLDNVVGLVSAVPTLITNVFQQVVGSTLFLGQKTLNTAIAAVEDLASLDLESAWNTTINGFLGPNGVLGNAVSLSLGTGVLTGDVETPFIPSLRQVLTGGTIGASLLLETDPVPAAAAVSPAASRTVAPAAAAAEVEAPVEISASDVKADAPADAPSVAATVADNDAAPQAGDGDKASAPKASKQRATRKAASE